MAEKAYKAYLPQGLACAVLLGVALFVAPYVVGYGIAFGGYVPYGNVCGKKDELFSGKIDRNDYTTFLMNRGCKYDEEVSRLLDDPDYKSVNKPFVTELIKNPDLRGRSADEISVVDAVKATARRFKPPEWGEPCDFMKSGADNCGLAGVSGSDPVANAASSVSDAYLSFFLPRMSDSIFDGAAALVEAIRKGPVFGAALSVIYALAILLLGALATKAVAWVAKDLLRSM